MRIKLVSLEDGIISCGFRKMASFVERLNPDTDARYICLEHYRDIGNAIRGTMADTGDLGADAVDEIARDLNDADLVGFSSMSNYAGATRAVICRMRELRPEGPYLVWGGIHPIIHPEDAIGSGVDAICTGEGELAVAELLQSLESGREDTTIRNLWFRRGDEVIRNGFRPLMTPEEMETMPFPQVRAESERIYKPGRGFVPLELQDYLATFGLAYETIWSIGCPFRCTYCGNTRFLANDRTYARLRHPSPRYIVQHVNEVRQRLPHVSSVIFDDDSFMAIPLPRLEEFAEAWREGVGLPFAVLGVIPNYVRRDKYEVLTWAGMNRIRMGVQSGSRTILDFYERPTPPERILEAGEVNASFAPRYHMPPSYDVIVDNPVETRKDVLDSLELFYRLRRPYTLQIYALKIIPNTNLERQLQERGIDIDRISSGYLNIAPRWANLLLYLLAVWRPPRWLWKRLLGRVEACTTEQPLYPRLGLLLRTLYLFRYGLRHLRFMDFSVIPGWAGYLCWRVGLVGFWQRFVKPKPATRPAVKPATGEHREAPAS